MLHLGQKLYSSIKTISTPHLKKRNMNVNIERPAKSKMEHVHSLYTELLQYTTYLELSVLKLQS